MVGNDNPTVGGIDREMHWILAERADAVEMGQLAGAGIDPECADVREIAVHGIKEPPAAIERQVRGIGEAGDELDVGPLFGWARRPIDVDAVPPRVALPGGTGTDVGEVSGRLGHLDDTPPRSRLGQTGLPEGLPEQRHAGAGNRASQQPTSGDPSSLHFVLTYCNYGHCAIPYDAWWGAPLADRGAGGARGKD